MNDYINISDSISSKISTESNNVLQIIANKYIADNPVEDVKFRVFNENGIKRDRDYRYHFHFNDKFPDAENESIVYAWAKLWRDKEEELEMSIWADSPVKVYANGELKYSANISWDTDIGNGRNFNIKLSKGWNSIVLRFKKVTTGFGGILGINPFFADFFHMLAPSKERNGQEGWIYTKPLKDDIENIPVGEISESLTGLKWYPKVNWSQDQLKKSVFERIYGICSDCYGVLYTKGKFNKIQDKEYTIKITSENPYILYINNEEIINSQGEDIKKIIKVPYGEQDIFIMSYCDINWDVSFEIDDVEFISPFKVLGTDSPFMYLGPIDKEEKINIKDLLKPYNIFKGKKENIYWKVDMPNCNVRASVESKLFGKWNYPLGVTLYGLIKSSELLENSSIKAYVKNHIELCTSYYEYSLWDKKKYGASVINYKLSDIGCLDECGSFGAATLELMQYGDITGGNKVTYDIADFIENKETRLKDGTFYRKNGNEGTLWADDLYMSVPFLCKYYRKTKEISYIEDAARQFIGYKKHLYISAHKIMSHVYDFAYNKATEIPWGRGNGWVLFSLSEILELLPDDNKFKVELLEMFNDLSLGYLKFQDNEGMWHQVITDLESYKETSCTSMFTYAISRGIRYGWIKDTEPYVKAVFKAWDALTKISIDNVGNIYGVCRGSNFSYTMEYYKYDLTWRLNDTHGIGIVMLAGYEIKRLEEFLAKKI